MNAVSALLSKALGQIPPSDELVEKIVIAAWKPAVGEALWMRTRPFRFFKSLLIVSVPSVAWRRELHHLQKEILDKLNALLGKGIVRALEFRVDPDFDKDQQPPLSRESTLPEEAVDLPLEKIKDPELARALAAAASKYFNRPKRKT
jgi:hypothetical protein